jgi:hypothetical protein
VSSDIPQKYIYPEYIDSLMEPPEAPVLNEIAGLPEQSVVLADVVGEYGERTAAKLLDVHQNAPFLLQNNFFLNNLLYFLQNYDEAKQLWIKISNLAGNLFSDSNDLAKNSYQITQALAVIAANRKISEIADMIDNVHDFLNALIHADQHESMQVSYNEFETITELLQLCMSAEDYQDMLSAIKQGHNTAHKIQNRSRIEMPKLGGVGLKILNGCTVQCRMCSEKALPGSEEWQTMSLSDLEELIPVLKEVGQVSVSGGEPFDHPDFVKICRFLAENKVPFTIITTGGEIDELTQILPLLKDGSVQSFTLSIHDQYGRKGKMRGSQTAAFLVRHNIPFKIELSAQRLEEIQARSQPMVSDLSKLGLSHGGFEHFKGRNSHIFIPESLIKRDPLVRLYVVPVYPAGNFTDNDDANRNAETMRQNLAFEVGSTLTFCRFGRPVIRAGRTVSPCDNVYEGGDSGVPRLMEHWPSSANELAGAMSRYRKRILRGVLSEATREKILPCVAHRRCGKKS